MVFDITWLTRQQLTPPKRILERHSKRTTISCEKREIRAKFTQNEVWWKHFLSIEIHWQRRLNIQPHNLVKKTKEVIPICSFRSFNVKLQLWPTSWLWVVLTNPSTMLESSITFNSSFCKARPSFRCVHSRKPNKKSFSYVDMWTTMKKIIKWRMTFFNEHRTEIWRLGSAICPLSLFRSDGFMSHSQSVLYMLDKTCCYEWTTQAQ